MPEKLCSSKPGTEGIAVLTVTGNSGGSAKELLHALQLHIAALSGKPDVKGILLSGGHDRFCRCRLTGSKSPQEAATLSGFGQSVMTNLEKTGRPCIAVVEGECSGLGFEIALAADFIVASESSTFGFPDIASGLIPFCGGSQRLSRLVGKSKTKELIYSGELLNAEEAHRIGLINRLYPTGDATVQAEKLLTHICTRSPHAIRIGGEVVNAGYDIDLHTACLLERDAFALCFAGFDQREGMQAFLDKRQPQFEGN
ncbi:MAG: enoyl-CoA hydratase-related protein [Desulfuromonadaceae bacterium]|nr:enoyl-CoA hydratase-related protein [Desulfuromonadaceae bacterium]